MNARALTLKHRFQSRVAALEEALGAISNTTSSLSDQFASGIVKVKAIAERVNKVEGKVTTNSWCPHKNAVAYAIFGRPCGTQRGYCMKMKGLEFTKIAFLSRAS